MNALLLLLVTLMSASARRFHYTLNGKNSWFSEYFYIYRDSSNYDSYSTHSGIYAYFNSPGNVQYEILLSTGSYGWVDGAWLKIYGEYNQLYFQSGPFDGKKPLSLYLPIDKGEYWSYSDSISSSTWMTDTTYWGSYTGGSSFTTGTRRYLKKTFSGANNIAAFEMSASYRHGIVVYVNGHEVYRDNVEEGPIYAFTQFTKPYSSQDFHSFIRSAYHITNGSDNVVAVMLLLPSEDPVTFDAWLALYSPSPAYTANDAMCYHTYSGSGKCSDLKESTTCTVNWFGEKVWTNLIAGVNGIGFSQTTLSSSNQRYYLEWRDYTESPSNQRQYSFSPSTTSKGWYQYGMPQVNGSDLTFWLTGGSMTFGEIDLLVCKKDNPQLLYPASVNVCYRGLPCTISPLAAVPSSVTAQDLPTGLSCNRNTGVISGTPTSLSTGSTITITSGNHVFKLQYKAVEPRAVSSFSYSGVLQVCQNRELGLKAIVTGAPYSVSIVSGSLPDGVTLDTDTGTIHGFPTEASSKDLQLKASNSLGNKETTITLNVTSVPQGYYYPSVKKAAVGNSFSVSPNHICVGCTFALKGSSQLLPSGVSLDANTGVISGSCNTIIASRRIDITISNACGSVKNGINLTIRPLPSIQYSQSQYTFALNSWVSISTTHSEVDSVSIVSGSLPEGLGLDEHTGEITGTATEAAVAVLRIKASNDVGNTEVEITITIGTRITQFDYVQTEFVKAKNEAMTLIPRIQGTCGSYSIKSGTLPTGLQLNSETGVISGTPTQSVSNRQITIQATGDYNSMTTTIVLSVMQRITSLSYPQNTYSIVKDHPFTATPSITGDSVTFSLKVGSLPSGLQLDPATGVISGTPTQSVSNYRSVIKATNALGDVTVSLTFNIGSAMTSFFYPQSEYILPKSVPFSATPTYTGDSIVFSITSGSLPTGLTLNSETGVISGTPTQSVSNRQVTIKAQNSLGSKTTTVKFTVLGAISSFSYPQSTYSIAKGVSFSASPNGSGDSVVFSIQSGSLPTGLTLNANSGVISGTPSQSVANRQVTIKAENELGSQTATLTFNVLVPISTFSYPKSTYSIAKGVSFSVTPSVSGESVTYSVSSGSLPTGLTLNASSGVISGTPTQSVSNSQVTIVAENAMGSKSFSLTFNVLASISSFSYPQSEYTLTKNTFFSVAPSVSGDSITYSITSGSLPTGLTLNSETGVISGTPSQSVSDRQVTIKAQNSLGSKTTTVKFTVIGAISSFSYPQSIYSIAKGSSFSASPNGSGDSVTYSIQSGTLPTGLTLNANSGVISGTPTQSVANREVTIKAQNSLGSQTFILTFNVLVPISTFSYPKSTYSIAKGVTFSVTPSVSGESVTYSVSSGSLPTGLTLNASNGVISGTPTQSVSNSQVTIVAENAMGSKSFSLTFNVLTSISSFSYPQSEYTLTKNTFFSVAPSVSGDSITYSITSGSLPVGLTLSSETGVISGTPTQFVSGREVTIKAQNNIGSKTTTLTFSVFASITSFSYPKSTYSIAKGVSFSASPNGSGDSITYSIQSGTLPTGLTLNANSGVISGTPTQSVSSREVTIKAENELGSQTATLTFNVLVPISTFSYPKSTYVIAKGASFSATPSVSGEYVTYSVTSGPLPTGLTLNANNGVISGTPSQSVFNREVTIKAQNTLGSKTVTLSFSVITSISSFSYPKSTYSIAKGVSFSASPNGSGDSITYSITSGSLPTGLSLNANSGVISGKPTQSVSNRQVTIKAQNTLGSKTTTLTFNVLGSISSFSYPKSTYVIAKGVSFSATPSASGDSIVFSITSGSLPTGLTLNANSGVISGTPSQSVASREVTIKAQNDLGSKTVTLTFKVLVPISSFSYPESTYSIERDEPFSASPSITGDSVTYSLVSGTLPNGLTLNTNSGVISGTPSRTILNREVTIKAQNSLGSKSVSLTFNTLIPVSYFSYPESTYSIEKDESFSETPSVIGDPVTYTLISGSLPAGLEMNPTSGIIWGAPSESVSNRQVTIKAENLLGSQTVTLIFNVLVPITSFSYPSANYAIERWQSFSASPSVNTQVESFSVESGSLPSGLSLNSATGEISGTPTVSDTGIVVTIRAQNAISTRSTTITFAVYNRITAFSYPQQSFVLSRAESATLTPSVTGDVVTFSVTSGSLISGLSLSSTTGVISGTPSQYASNRQVTIEACNPLSCKTYSLTLTALQPVRSFSYPSMSYVFAKGSSVSVSASATGDLITYSVTTGQLPTGLTLSSATGAITGVPSQSVNMARSITITAENDLGSQTVTMTIQVLEKPTQLSYPSEEYNIAVGETVSLTPSFNGDLLTFSVTQGSLPSGLVLDAKTGVISGKATTSTAQQSITIGATNSVGSRSVTITIRVVISITAYRYSNTEYTLVNGKRYKLTPSITGEKPSFLIVNGTLPDGLILNAVTGVIEGEPIDMFLKTSVYLQAKNAVSSSEVGLTFTVLPLSMGLIILIAVLVVVIIVVSICCCCCCRKKTTMAVESLDDLKDSLPEPVPAEHAQEVSSPTTAVVINPVQTVPVASSQPVVNAQPMMVSPNVAMMNPGMATINPNAAMVNPGMATINPRVPMTNPSTYMNSTVPGMNQPVPSIYQQAPPGNVFPTTDPSVIVV